MNEGRAYVLRVWQLAEELAVHAGKPLHAFLLLHHLLTCPPASLRHASTALLSSTAAAPSSPSAAVPLHVAALDAGWKCEELATRVRAAEYLLSPAAQAPVQPTTETSDRSAVPRTLSRAAALESLELAEQVLAPVFTTTSSTAAASSRSAATPSSHALEAAMQEVANASTATSQKTQQQHQQQQQQRMSSSSPLQASLLSSGGGGGGTSAEMRGVQMYFFNESTVTALAWPLSAFLLDWPRHATDASTTREATVTYPSSSSAPPLSFKAANHTIMVAVALVVRAHVLQAVVCYRRVQYRRALQCLAEARRWVQLQFTPQARQRSLRLLWADLRERWWWCAATSAAPAVSLGLEHLPHFERIVEHLMEREQRACETMISVEECRVHWMVLQSCGTVPPLPLPRPPPRNGSDATTMSCQHASVGGSGQAGAHTPDLRLHFKRYHESVQQLHQVSRVYMAVLEWTASEEETEEDESRHGVRVKREGEEHSSDGGNQGRTQTSSPSPSRSHVWRAQSQLSPFCLCALHRRGKSSAAPPVAKMEPVESYVVAYDQRLAAEVLGWYHCMSLLFLLYEPSLSALAGSGPATSRSAGASISDAVEGKFLEHHARAPLHLTLLSNAPRTAAATAAATVVMETPAVTSDPVQRARAHFRAYAAVFGGTSSSSASAATAGGSGDGAGETLAHEAGLLWCLAELALVDGYPAALRFCASLSDGSPLAGGGSVALKEEPKEEEEEALAETRKRRRSVLCAPASSHWVVSGVREVLQLYVRLQTVLMQAAATMQGTSTPPLSPSSPPSTGATAASTTTSPPVPVLQAGLQRAERVLARLLFRVDREMLQLTGNAWGGMNAFAGPSAPPQQQGMEHSSATVDGATCFSRLPPWVRVDQLQSSPPAQLRWLVQLKAAALLTMARLHSTQLSLVRAVHHLRELQHFTRVFHRQAKVSLVPEMHVLLAAMATCMSLRRLPEEASPRRRQQQRQPPHRRSASENDEAEDEEEEKAGLGRHVAVDVRRGLRCDSRTPGEALFAFARGWPQADVSAAVTTPTHSLQAFHSATTVKGPAAAALYSITPEEESTIAQDVGLPYLHLLAAERAACTSLHTPPSLLLLLYLMKAWAVYQLVVAGEELTWTMITTTTTIAARVRSVSPLPMCVPHPPLPPSPQQQQQQSSCSAIVSPLSPACPPLPLPTASYATTTLNTTQEDQQRRVARLDSLTSTPTHTPTLRSRHAALPGEMQRIQLEPPAILSPLLFPRRGDESKEGTTGPEAGTQDPVGAFVPCLPPPVRPLSRTEAAADTHRAPPPPPPPLQPRPRAEVTAVPQTVRHRAADVLQRMLAVLRHHHEGHTHYLATLSPTTTARAAVPTTAWTPQNITLYRLLHGAVTLTEDRDEPAAARELKETTHYAKQHLGVLHPFVADGLALLTSAYTSLDVDAEGVSGGGGGGGVGGSAARTRRVAVQLAMRCSCTALASLAESDAAGIKTVALSSTPAAPMTPLDSQADPATPQLAAVHARLREWWSTEVLGELCGNGSVHRSTHALGQLQALFGWLPGVEGGDP